MKNTKEETKAINRSKEKLEEKFYIVDILHEDLETLLNLIERQQREIESAKEALKYQCKIAEQRNQLLIENKELKYKYERALSDLVKAEKKTEDSISKEAIREKIEKLNERIKRDMINHDKCEYEGWKIAIGRSIERKMEVRKVLEELLKEK